VTAVAALMLYEEGRFDLDDPVSPWIPEFAKFKVWRTRTSGDGQLDSLEKQITFRHLLTHTSGLGYGIFTEPIEADYRAAEVVSPIITLRRPLAEMIRVITSIPLKAQPGAGWHYSVGHDVIGYLIGLISGQPFDVYLRERIFEPLGMTDTGFHVPQAKLERFGPLYSAPGENGLVVVDDLITGHFVGDEVAPSGGAGLVSSMPDYLQFMSMLANDGELNGVRLLKATTVARMATNELTGSTYPVHFDEHLWGGMGYGLGIGVQVEAALEAGVPAGVFGWAGASGTNAWIYPAEKMIMLAMPQAFTNHEPSGIFRKMVFDAIVD